ncbi:MAG: YlxM family DNA-binding protein [Firmicutes bacterium]|nr:YlxM family DNA-binding protein [Bacillota bacterium]MBR6823466.1 YlxM family DNA-binding protein [Bacillota bacterium]
MTDAAKSADKEKVLIEKIIGFGLLFDFYGQLLTDKQQQALRLSYEEDLSLGEIARLTDCTRQAAHDLIRRSEQLLLHYEEKLGLIALHLKRQQKAAEVERVAEILRRDPSDFLWAEYESRWKEFKECE